ncbi:DNA replication/repair protein RecF [Gudongella sp. DL1XJH-153]|uniref:DNA replication/repair protein RecF n=1 Tax=Gudongella sp. DL1XJH-153 TaxID=3409804 RepID=UPI003BB6C040
MIVEGIRLINFRNYNNVGVSFNPGINILVGKNAQGKTNLLEAIYLCSTGRSFRTNRDKEIINFQKDEAYIGTQLKIGERDKLTEIKLERNKPKRIKVNKTELKNYKELDTGLKVVLFSPEDLKLIKEGPSNRRTYLDASISQIKPLYHYNLRRYYKILLQRNNLIKSYRFKGDMAGLLDVFDIQLAKSGALIMLERDNYVKRLLKESSEIHNMLTAGKEKLDIKYISSVPCGDTLSEVEGILAESLRKNRDKDIEVRTTEIGPHRDDFGIMINNNDSKTYASQGQQRSLVLTLKLSEVEILMKDTGYYPVLLLDDVYSELDEERRKYLTKLFSKMQTFITTTDAVEIDGLESYNKEYFYVQEGCLYKGIKTWREVNGQ